MTTYVINGEDATVSVEIQFPNENNRLDTVFIQGFSKAKLPAFSRVTQGFLMTHPKVRTQKVDELNELPVAASK